MTRWYTEKKREHFYREAKRQGYRARSSFKLKQIQRRYSLFQNGDWVLDLGAAPGGWSQIAKELVGDTGFVLGVDLLPIQSLPGVSFLQGDLTDESTLVLIREALESNPVHVVISDMSPNISGTYSIDHARSIYLCEHALSIASLLLKKNGHFVCKVFSGSDLEEFVGKVNSLFRNVYRFSPPASRKSSSEVYLIAKNFQ
jgi:23S rRNA (uridine2552-2'-O)-methyltransferase